MFLEMSGPLSIIVVAAQFFRKDEKEGTMDGRNTVVECNTECTTVVYYN